MVGKPYGPIYELAVREGEKLLGKPVNRARVLCIGDDVVVRISVISVDQESARVELNCEGFVDGKLIMDGVAVVRVPRRRRPARD